MDPNPAPIDSTGETSCAFLFSGLHATRANPSLLDMSPLNRKVIPAQNLCNGRLGRHLFMFGTSSGSGAAILQWSVQHVCEATALSDHRTGVGRKSSAGKGRSRTSPQSCAPREPGFASILLRLASILLHMARGRVALLGLCSRDSPIRSAARCQLAAAEPFPRSGGPHDARCCGDSLQLASTDVLESIDRAMHLSMPTRGIPPP
jgi:hypothetical protein